uniref:Uncharacterized protein n=1 Tax=Panagrolaimus davidi TaxID=227884 RepID=A0A914R2J9_9BILA
MYLYVVVGHRPAVDGEPSNNNQPSVIDLTVSEEKFTKSDIEKLIKNKSPIVVLIDRKDENTEVLNVGIKEEGKKQISTTFCYCPDCKSVMTRGGNIKRHACRGTKRAKPRESIDSFIQNSLTLKETTNLARVIGGFALDAGVSFSLCESQPFQTLAKNIFNLG